MRLNCWTVCPGAPHLRFLISLVSSLKCANTMVDYSITLFLPGSGGQTTHERQIRITAFLCRRDKSLLSSHLWDVGDALHWNLSGADDLRGSGVQDLDGDGEQETGPEGHALSESVIQVLVLVHQGVLTSGAVHVDPGRAERGQEAWGGWMERICDYAEIRNKLI